MGRADRSLGEEFLDHLAALHPVRRGADGGDELGVADGGLPHALSGGQIGRHARLGEDVLPAAEREARGIRVEEWRRADPHDVHAIVVHHVLPAGDGGGARRVPVTKVPRARQGGV